MGQTIHLDFVSSVQDCSLSNFAFSSVSCDDTRSMSVVIHLAKLFITSILSITSMKSRYLPLESRNGAMQIDSNQLQCRIFIEIYPTRIRNSSFFLSIAFCSSWRNCLISDMEYFSNNSSGGVLNRHSNDAISTKHSPAWSVKIYQPAPIYR